MSRAASLGSDAGAATESTPYWCGLSVGRLSRSGRSGPTSAPWPSASGHGCSAGMALIGGTYLAKVDLARDFEANTLIAKR